MKKTKSFKKIEIRDRYECIKQIFLGKFTVHKIYNIADIGNKIWLYDDENRAWSWDNENTFNTYFKLIAKKS